jgi:hypothetical protein
MIARKRRMIIFVADFQKDRTIAALLLTHGRNYRFSEATY